MGLLSPIAASMWTAWLVLLLSLGVTLWGWQATSAAQNQRAQERFEQEAEQTVEAISNRLHHYKSGLISGGALFAATQEVTREEWRAFVSAHRLHEDYPAMQWLAVSFRVLAQDKEAYLKRLHSQGFPRYAIYPAGERPEYFALEFIEPFNEANQRKLGFDFYVDPIRKAALEQARDMGEAVLTSQLLMPPDQGQRIIAGVLSLPLYRIDTPANTPDERRKALIGFVSSALAMHDLMRGILDKKSPLLSLEIFEGGGTEPKTLLYDNLAEIPNKVWAQPALTKLATLKFAGQTWTIRLSTTEAFEAQTDSNKPILVLTGGLLLTALLFGITATLAGTRARAAALADHMTEALKASEERYELAIRSSATGLWDWNILTGSVYYTPRWKELIGYRDDEIGSQFSEFESRLHPDDAELVRKAIHLHINERSPFDVEFRLRAKDGSYRWIRSRGQAVWGPDGQAVRMVGAHTDVTNRRLAQDEIQKLNAELERRVHERTADLEVVNLELQREIEEHANTGLALQRTNYELSSSVKRLEQHTRDSTLLAEMGDMLQTCVTIDEANTAVARYVQEIFSAPAGGIFLMHPSRHMLEAGVTWGGLPSRDHIFAPDDCWALRRSKVHWADGQEDMRCRHVSGDDQSGYCCLPLFVHGESLGILHLRLPDLKCRPLDATHKLAETVAEHVGLAVANIQLRETLHNQSIRDPLTGLFNRRYLEETMLREERRAARDGLPIGIIMFDIDHFKRLNDTHGHAAGDVLLRQLGLLLLSLTREGDIACRWGGEEFMVILPGANAETTCQRAEELRVAIAHMAVEFEGQPLEAMTISLGVAVFPEHGQNWQEVVQRADQALYRSKESGRNRVTVA